MKTTSLLMIQSEWMNALGWTFVHSIWEVAIIGLLLFVVLKFVPTKSAHLRYTISTMALWTIVVTAISTFIVMLPETKTLSAGNGGIFIIREQIDVSTATQIKSWLENQMPMMLTIWFGGVALLMLRLALSLGWVSHLKYDSFHEEQLQATVNQIVSRLKLKVKTVTAESYLIKSPMTVGHIKPMILFPVGIINQLTPNEVEAILTHELAHIVRKDYLSNLMQSFIETIFYYHPVTWWISRTVRTERENRADDLAVSWCGDHLGYAKALLTVQELQVAHTPHLAIGFASRKGAMLARIQRILNLPHKNHNQMEKSVLLSLCSICFLAFTLTGHTAEPTNPDKKREASNIIQVNAEVADTIPSTGTYKIHKKTDDQDISVEVENGDIKELKVDGKEISRSAYAEYDKIIHELFGVIEPIPAPGAYAFTMPHSDFMPAIPPVPGVPGEYKFNFAMPDWEHLAEMEGLQKMELEKLMEGLNFNTDQMAINLNGAKLKGCPPMIQLGEGMNFDFHIDSFENGEVKWIVIGDGDSLMLASPGMYFNGEWPAEMELLQGFMLDKQAMRESQRAMRDQMRQHAEHLRLEKDQWREGQQEFRENMRAHAEMERARQQELRSQNRAFELRTYELPVPPSPGSPAELNFFYPAPSPRNIGDQMVRDGLIGSNEEVEILLTKDKLKIDGKKMDDATHQKYLRMYEAQQGVELSGNSRVEFTTKTKQRM